jgi:hypothetical protein
MAHIMPAAPAPITTTSNKSGSPFTRPHMADRPRDPSQKPPPEDGASSPKAKPADQRETRLAAALRANLRRRKAAQDEC